MSDAELDDRLVANLLAYEEALAATGDFVEARQQSGIFPAELADQLERAQECIDLLSLLWPPDRPSSPQLAPPPAVAETKTSEPPLRPAGPPLKDITEFGRFRLLEVLGQGGVGTVYKALHTRLDRVVALKVLNSRWVTDAESHARFCREMRTIGKLQHPNLVAALDADQWQGVHYLVMEYVPGLDLQTIVRRSGPLPVADACEVARQAALALAYIHHQGFVHRDVKPANLMLGDDGQVRLLDMGLAMLKDPGPDDALTRKGQVVGTVDFMAPEQMLDTHAVNDPTDLYSLGCTLFYLLCGRPPFASNFFDTPGKKALAHATLAAPPLEQLRVEVPAALAALVSGLMAKDPAQRPVSARVVVKLLEPFCQGASLAALIKSLAVPADAAAAIQGTGRASGTRLGNGGASGTPLGTGQASGTPARSGTGEAQSTLAGTAGGTLASAGMPDAGGAGGTRARADGAPQPPQKAPWYGQFGFFLLLATAAFVVMLVTFPGDCRQADPGKPAAVPVEEPPADSSAKPVYSAVEPEPDAPAAGRGEQPPKMPP